MTQGRSIVKQIFTNFINSLKPRNFWGELKGRDSYGTEYYESKSPNKSRSTRWFVPIKKGDIEHEIPVEWTAWLRHKRKQPPTEEEIQMNLLKMNQTIENARKLEGSKEKPKEQFSTSKPGSFPVYEDYDSPDKGFK